MTHTPAHTQMHTRTLSHKYTHSHTRTNKHTHTNKLTHTYTYGRSLCHSVYFSVILSCSLSLSLSQSIHIYICIYNTDLIIPGWCIFTGQRCSRTTRPPSRQNFYLTLWHQRIYFPRNIQLLYTPETVSLLIV